MNNRSNGSLIEQIEQGKTDQLDGDDWFWLLIEQPQYADYCQWDKLDGWNWSWLLCDQPQLAQHCQWDKLDTVDWDQLVFEQPQFKDHPLYKLSKL